MRFGVSRSSINGISGSSHRRGAVRDLGAMPVKAWMKIHRNRLIDKGKIEKLVLSLRSV
jgi:hypothetical protein